jgi:Tol biopolymer transport system component
MSMNVRRTCNPFIAIFALLYLCSGALTIGIFEDHADIGNTPKKGSIEYNAAAGEYRVTGGGANIWAATDAFQFAWKRLSGDVTITADVQFAGTGAVNHRKAVLMVRQNLNPDSAYADVALHGDGLTSLQFRPSAGALTQEIRSTVNAPSRIRIERRGDRFTMYAGKAGEELTPAGPATVALQDPVYVGIGVCSHDANTLETAVFSNAKIEPQAPQISQRTRYGSRISIYTLNTRSVRVIYATADQFEAPNWSPGGKHLLSNSGGALFHIPVEGNGAATPEKLDVGSDLRCNNDHGFSPDGKQLAISASSAASRGSLVYIVSVDGSRRRQMTTMAPSYFHGWSPDGKWLAIVAQRNGNFDLFRIPEAGGEEQRLTSNAAYDDGPDYSPDGKWIYFNSNRSGSWDIWRMPSDGAGPDDAKAEQVTRDELEDWFPHPSPDGKWLVFLSFPKGTSGHNDKLDVQLRMIPLPAGKIGDAPIQALTKFFGGQGTINVNSWSPDSKRFAFVSYEPLP